MTGSISLPIQGCLTIQRNTNMLKILKKVGFCRFYRFLCKKTVPRLSPERTFVLRDNFTTNCILDTYETQNTFCVGK